jgi:hypothetical protein
MVEDLGFAIYIIFDINQIMILWHKMVVNKNCATADVVTWSGQFKDSIWDAMSLYRPKLKWWVGPQSSKCKFEFTGPNQILEFIFM